MSLRFRHDREGHTLPRRVVLAISTWWGGYAHPRHVGGRSGGQQEGRAPGHLGAPMNFFLFYILTNQQTYDTARGILLLVVPFHFDAARRDLPPSHRVFVPILTRQGGVRPSSCHPTSTQRGNPPPRRSHFDAIRRGTRPLLVVSSCFDTVRRGFPSLFTSRCDEEGYVLLVPVFK